MLTSNRLAKNLGFAVLVITLGGVVAEARTRKGDKLLAESRAAELRKDWDKAISFAEQALSEDPADVGYQLTASRLRFYSAQFHIDQGLKLRGQGQLEQALPEFQKAYGINPASTLAGEEVERTKQMIERAKQQPELKPEERALTPSQIEKQKEDKKFASMEPLPELKPLNPEPIFLKMNNQPPKVLFETVGKYAGVNVLFDPDYTTGAQKPQSIEVNNSTLSEALDYLALITKSFWKPISANAIFVTQDNPTTRRTFEDWVVKVFYLQNVLTTQELTEISTAVRTAVDLQKVMIYNAQNAIIVRGEADKVALAAKIIADLDKPKGEVLVDVLVMTVSSQVERDLAAALAPNGINSPISFTPQGSISTPVASTTGTTGTTGVATPSNSTTIPLSNIARLSTRDFSLTVPGGLLNALLTNSSTKVLQRPQVRAVDRQKVEMKIGDRVPYATGSYQPGVGGVGINPLVNTQFQFLDTGVNITMVPVVHGTDEVSLHVEVDISNVTGSVPLGGINEPEVSQTKVINDVRLKQGEVNLMGGLMQVEEDKTVSGVPGLGDIPILRRLFTSETTTKKYSELVIVLIPHVIRSAEITDVNLREIASGNATNVKVTYAQPKPAEAPAAAPAPPSAGGQPVTQPAPVVVPTVPAPVASPTVAAPARPFQSGPVPPIPGVTIPPIGAPNTSTGPATPPATAPPVPPAKPVSQVQAPAGNAKVKFVPAEASTLVSGIVTVSLMVENAADLASTPLQIRFDPKILRLNDVVRGNLLASDGQQVTFSKNILNDTGEATVTANRFPATGGVTGSGSIVTLVFQAVGPGDTVVTAPSLTLRNSQSQAILTATPHLAVSVK